MWLQEQPFGANRCFLCPAHLFVGARNESVFGKLSHDVEVRPQVQLAADQHHFGTGTELLRLPLPLRVHGQKHKNRMRTVEKQTHFQSPNYTPAITPQAAVCG